MINMYLYNFLNRVRSEAEVISGISIEGAEFSIEEDREVLLRLVDELFTSRSGGESETNLGRK